jgi:dTDP-4-amino-4,6-dideoxygalactose transaminase
MNKLAVFGGPPTRTKSWPRWPQASKKSKEYLVDVLHSGRWGIGGKYNGTPLFNIQFAETFAELHNVPYCITVANGSAALTVALEALGVGFGDEVIVPGLAWISCATAITRIGAVPILLDVEPDTLCISAEAARNAISERTKAVIVVHSYCTVADLDALVALSTNTGIPLVEDCSQAHGAQWNRQRVGTFGKIGVFSMGNSKVLSCGEGGAILTSDPLLYDRLQQLSADGYRFKNLPAHLGESQLEEVGTLQGHNYCLSEFQAAVLLGGLADMDEQNELREENGEYFRKLCGQIGDVVQLTRDPRITKLTYFRLCVRLNMSAFGGASIGQIRKALIAELNESTIEPVDHPLNDYVLYKPLKLSIGPSTLIEQQRLDPKRFDLPVASQAYKECITFHHSMLLGNKNDVEDIIKALLKLKENCKMLARVQLHAI